MKQKAANREPTKPLVTVIESVLWSIAWLKSSSLCLPNTLYVNYHNILDYVYVVSDTSHWFFCHTDITISLSFCWQQARSLETHTHHAYRSKTVTHSFNSSSQPRPTTIVLQFHSLRRQIPQISDHDNHRQLPPSTNTHIFRTETRNALRYFTEWRHSSKRSRHKQPIN